MRKKYYFHPSSYSLSEIEEFYEKKASEGLILDTRGNFLSGFRKEEPKNLSYRVEVIDYDKLKEHKIPDEQVAVYEDCGWTHVCGHHHIQIFSADKDTDPPELYYQPQDQIDSIKILRKSVSKRLLSLLFSWTLLGAVQFYIFAGGSFKAFIHNQFFIYILYLVEFPTLALLFPLILVKGLGEYVFGIISSQYYITRLKKGIPLRKIKPFAKKLKPFKKGVTAVILLALLFMGIREILSYEKVGDPSAIDGPFLSLADFGLEKAPPKPGSYLGEDYLKKRTTIWGEVISVFESDNKHNISSALFQDVYRVKDSGLRDKLVDVLRRENIYGIYNGEYTELTIPGLDKVYETSGRDLIVVKDDFVISISGYLQERITQEMMLEKLSKILSEEEFTIVSP